MKSLKAILLCLALLIGIIGLSAQTYDWAWAKAGGGMGSTSGSSIATNSTGNQYVTGSFYGTSSIGSTTLSSNGNADIFIAKTDPDGNWLWAISAGGTGADEPLCIEVDASDHIYVTGYFNGSAIFGSVSLSSSGEDDVFIAKLDNNGNWLWIKRAGGVEPDIGKGISIDSNSNVYVTGDFCGDAMMGSTIITSSGDYDIFVAKLDSDGNWLWAISAGGLDRTTSQSIAMDNSANIYITGQFTGTTYFDTIALASSGSYDLYVAKMDSSGNWLWAVKADGTNDGVGYDIAVNAGSEIYVTGWFDGTATYGPTTITSVSVNDVFISKLSSDGIWLWTMRAGGTGNDYGYSISVDNAENIFVTGSFRDTADFGSTTLTSIPSGWADIFAVRLDSNGNFLQVVQAGGQNWDEAYGISVDSESNIYLTGDFSGSASFGSTTITTNANTTIFVAKLSHPPFFEIDLNQIGVAYGSTAWGDYDNDGDLDILVSGSCNGTGDQSICRIYRNNGNDVFSDINANLVDIYCSTLDWGDYDSDGDLDILLSGVFNIGGTDQRSAVSRVYRNDGDGLFTDINAGLINVFFGAAAWGDYDNDGDLDILITGQDANNYSPLWYSRVYRYEGYDTFADIDAGMVGMTASSIAWGDCDNDGDLDILITGTSHDNSYPYNASYNAKIYKNNTAIHNTIPNTPTNLRAQTVGDYINFEWDAATDAQTPSLGLNYLLRIGTTPGGDDVSSPMSLDSGLRLLPKMGYAGSSCCWKIKADVLPEGTDCYWSVQAIDTAFSGSLFATESIFLPEPILEITPITPVNFPDTYLGYYSDVSELWIQNTGRAILTLDSFSFNLSNSPIQVIEPISPAQITAGDSVAIHLRFTPQIAGNVSDSLFISNNSLNMPIAKIRLSGRGVIVPPKPPLSLQITMVGNDAVINWDAVTQTIFDTPISPDYYFVFSCHTPYGEFVFNGATSGLQYTHSLVGALQPRMFYKVLAYKYYGRGEVDLAAQGLQPGMTENEVITILNRCYNEVLGLGGK